MSYVAQTDKRGRIIARDAEEAAVYALLGTPYVLATDAASTAGAELGDYEALYGSQTPALPSVDSEATSEESGQQETTGDVRMARWIEAMDAASERQARAKSSAEFQEIKARAERAAGTHRARATELGEKISELEDAVRLRKRRDAKLSTLWEAMESAHAEWFAAMFDPKRSDYAAQRAYRDAQSALRKAGVRGAEIDKRNCELNDAARSCYADQISEKYG